MLNLSKSILDEVYIDDLQTKWKESTLPVNNPKNYFKLEGDGNNRVADLIRLLELIYLIATENLDYYKSKKDQKIIALQKYIYSDIIVPFQIIEFVSDREPEKNHNDQIRLLISNKLKINTQDKSDDFKNWLSEILINSKRANWVPLVDYPTIDDSSNEKEFSRFFEIRYTRLLHLAKLCHFIDELQMADYIENQIKIDKRGKFSGNTDKLKYGASHKLSSFLGQHIIRNFPFKDFTRFKSVGYQKNAEKSGSIYEHFTPISFFRDLIWVKNFDSHYVFDFESPSSKPFTVNEWISILWYKYRTISISKNEDNLINQMGEKSRRSSGNQAYDKAGIEIWHEQIKTWSKIHALENLERTMK